LDNVWTIVGQGDGTVELTLLAGPRPLVAKVTQSEFEALAVVIPQVADTVGRGEFSRVQLAAAFRAAIGRDPFKQATRESSRPGRFAGWLDLAYIVIGLGFAAEQDNRWLRLAGYGFAAVAFGDLVRRVWRRFRR
jgi:hypothetical protein